jgi:hypothetical protein
MAHSPDESGAVLALGVMERLGWSTKGWEPGSTCGLSGRLVIEAGFGVPTLDGAELSP